jgi:hypothetical protein
LTSLDYPPRAKKIDSAGMEKHDSHVMHWRTHKALAALITKLRKLLREGVRL